MFKNLGRLRLFVQLGTYILFFLLPWQTRLIFRYGNLRGEYLEYLSVSLYAVDILALLVVLAALIYSFKQLRADRGRKIPKYLWLLAAWELVIFISALIAQDRVLAFSHYFSFLLGVGIFWLVKNADQFGISRNNLVRFLVAGAIVQVLIGSYQFLLQDSFSSKYLGLAHHYAGTPGDAVIETADGRWLRAYGGLDHPNVFGGFLVLILILFIDLLLRSENRKLKVIDYLWGLLLITGIFFAFSRAAWLAFLVPFFCWFLWWSRPPFSEALKKIMPGLAAAAVWVLIIASMLSGFITTRLEGNARLEEKSNTERVTYLHDARSLLSKNWLGGVGIGNYSLALSEFDDSRPAYAYQPVHNIWLLIWAETGIFGLLAVISFGLYWVWEFYKQRSTIALTLIFSLGILSLLDHWLWSSNFGLLFSFAIIGLATTAASDRYRQGVLRFKKRF